MHLGGPLADGEVTGDRAKALAFDRAHHDHVALPGREPRQSGPEPPLLLSHDEPAQGFLAHVRHVGRGRLAVDAFASATTQAIERAIARASNRPGERGVRVRRINYNFKDVEGFSWITNNPRMNEILNEELARDEPDVVHVHHLTCLSTGMLDVVADAGIPLVMTLHDFWMSCLRGQRIVPELEICGHLDRGRCAPCLQRLWPHFDITPEVLAELDVVLRGRMARCDALIAPSKFHRDRCLEQGLPADRFHVIEHGLDHDLLPASERERTSVRKIGFIGSVIPTKGVHLLIEAMNRIGRADVECHVHGLAPNFHGDTTFLERCRELARDDLPFHFHGAYTQAELPQILEDLDLLVIPGLWWEAFCLTIREAMLAGVPVIASDLGAMHEALADLDEDVLFRPGDPQDMVHKITSLLDDAPRLARLSNLRSRVRTLDDMGADTEALYQQVAAHRERRRLHREVLKERKRKGADRPYATVFFPTWNGGELFERILDKVLAQKTDFDFEVLCIDSGSKDGTVDVIRARKDVRLIEIPNEEFNHGLTRNRGVAEARGEIVALLTQDAEPFDENWLQTLVDVFDDPGVAGAYCHQIPRPDCNPFQRDRLRGWTHGEGSPERKHLDDPKRWQDMVPFERYRLIAFDDVASCVRASVMEEIPYEKRQFGEDGRLGQGRDPGRTHARHGTARGRDPLPQLTDLVRVSTGLSGSSEPA